MFNIVVAGENAIIIYFGHKIDASLPAKINFFANKLKNKFSDAIINLIPSYTSLHLSYKLEAFSQQEFIDIVGEYLTKNEYISITNSTKLIKIPVFYDESVGFDIERLLVKKNLTLNEFINLHSRKKYLVYAVGFSPAFAFLAKVDKRIQLPRLATPRVNIPKGSVGIADRQTGVYPSMSSGGWNIIGRTPINLSLTNIKNIKRFNIGDSVIFTPIDKEQYLSIGGVI